MTSRSNFDYLSPLDTRYYGDSEAVFDALHPYLSESATIRYQVKVEQAITATLEARGIAPGGISRRLAKAAEALTPEEVYEEEHKTHHNIRALVNCLRRRLPEQDHGYIHLFATSADIQDTARSLALRDFTHEQLIPALTKLVDCLTGLADKHAATPQIGRTHGRYAEPITVGYWLANFVVRVTQRAEKVTNAAHDLRGMFSGAVGAHSALALRWPGDPAEIETEVLGRLGLIPGDGSVSTQVIQPEYLCDYGHSLVSLFGVMANIADDYRQLMRSEIEEVEERLDQYQVGSSTMPHKINPKNFENVKSLWKAVMPRMATVYMDQISEHQRDLTNSASTRFFNELVATTYYGVYRIRDAIEKTKINEPKIRANLEASYDWVVAEPLYIAFALAGHKDPYYKLRGFVLQARESGKDVLTLVKEDTEARDIWERLPPHQREAILNPDQYIGDAIQRTKSVCHEAAMRMKRLAVQLERPRESSTLLAA